MAIPVMGSVGAAIRRFPQTAASYVLLDWCSSAAAFLFMAVTFRLSAEGQDLGSNAWLLAMMNTMLFLSAAIQYYGMLREASPLRAYGAFVPLLLVELAVVRFLLEPGQWWIACLAVVMNLYAAAFRGGRMAEGRLAFAAAMNLTEQLLRVLLLLLGVYVFHLQVGAAVLLAILVAYAATFFYALASSPRQKLFPLGKGDFRQAAYFAWMYLILSLITGADVIVLKQAPDLLARYALVKPWGLGLYSLSVPLITLILKRLGEKKSVWDILAFAAGLYGLVFGVALGSGGYWNRLLFHKPMPSVAVSAAVLLAHGAMALVAALLQIRLVKKP